jgi:hypothetical protein
LVSSEAISTRLPSRSKALGDLSRWWWFCPALQADHQDRGGRIVDLERAGVALAGQHMDKLVMDDLDHLLAGGDRFGDRLAGGGLLHPANEIARHGERDVGFQERHAHLAQGGLDVVLAQRALLGQPVEDAGEPVGKRFEHGARAPWLQSANAHGPPRAQRADGGRS